MWGLTCHSQSDCLLRADAVQEADPAGDLGALVAAAVVFEHQSGAAQL